MSLPPAQRPSHAWQEYFFPHAWCYECRYCNARVQVPIAAIPTQGELQDEWLYQRLCQTIPTCLTNTP